jgi:hypothetical protein
MDELWQFETTFNNISAISWQSVFLWKNQSNWRKPLTFHKSLSNFISRKQQTLLPLGKISGKRN